MLSCQATSDVVVERQPWVLEFAGPTFIRRNLNSVLEYRRKEAGVTGPSNRGDIRFQTRRREQIPCGPALVSDLLCCRTHRFRPSQLVRDSGGTGSRRPITQRGYRPRKELGCSFSTRITTLVIRIRPTKG